MTYQFAIGNNRKSDSVQSQLDWTQVVTRLRNVERCEHTMQQYADMSKKQQIDAKDVGFFIPGHVDKRRVIFRQMLALDIDDADATTLDDLRSWLNGHAYVIHSTHSSTPEKPRYRVVVPLSQMVMAEEHGAILGILHEKLHLPLDPATLDFNRIMFLPSIPKDAPYAFEEGEGVPMDPKDILALREDWTDLSSIPVARTVKVQEPTTKPGLVGAFCSKVSIREALRTYLSDKWKEEKNGRYTLVGASTWGGGIIYEGKFLYSNHSSDPYVGRCHNAYDAVRLYNYGPGKEGEAQMIKLCESLNIKAGDNSVHSRTLNEMDDDDARVILQERLVLDKQGRLVPSLTNAELIMDYDPNIRNIFSYDLFSESPVLKRTPPWRTFDIRVESEDCKDVQTYTEMEDLDESYLRRYFIASYDFDPKTVLKDVLNITTHKNAFHPIRDYLNSLEWDGVSRLSTIFIDCFGVPDSRYTREVGIKFFVGAVRRVFMPSSKMDYVPVLVSEEGYGKSRFIRRMAKLWGSDTFYTFSGGKEAYEQLRGVWIMEIPELDGVQSRNTNSRKAFVTKGEDRYRSAYLKYTKTYKRQCVFIASSNDVVFLNDPAEEGRRWWGMVCRKEYITISVHDHEFLDRVNLYWAEAVHHFRQGVLPVLSPEAEEEARQMRQIHKLENASMGALVDYLNMPVPDDWYKMDTFKHVQYINDPDRWEGKPRDYICNVEVAMEFFNYERKQLDVSTSRKVTEAIFATKMFAKSGTKKRFGVYGSTHAWKRKEPIDYITEKTKDDEPESKGDDTITITGA